MGGGMRRGGGGEEAMSLRRRMALALVGVTVSVALVRPALAQKVEVDWDKTADLSVYKTFAWREGTPTPNPLMDQRVKVAVEFYLIMAGLTKTEGTPDMFVTYHAGSSEDVSFTTTSFGYYGWWGASTSTTRMHTSEKGTVVVDMWNSRDGKLFFRGTATDSVSDSPEKNEQKVNRAVERMLRTFPPQD